MEEPKGKAGRKPWSQADCHHVTKKCVSHGLMRTFWQGQGSFFASNKEDQEAACTARVFFKFWCAVAANKRFALSLWLSSADAERAISALNSIATALCSVMS